MQPNPKSTRRGTLVNDSHLRSYDPSAPYRAMMMPPPAATTEMPPNNYYSANPTLSQDVPSTNIDPRTGVVKQIPRFYYPRYGDEDDPPFTQPVVQQPVVQQPVVQQPVRKEVVPYPQPIPVSTNPYAPDQYHPYSTPYLIPLSTNIDPGPTLQEESKSDVIAAHQKDADLSRLEVYHFTPKQNTSSVMRTVPAPPPQPIVQYHVYPHPPTRAGSLPPMPLQQQQFPSYPPPWYGHPSNVPPYAPEPSQLVLPLIETTARGCQTELPSTKNRGVSPIHFSSAAPIYDDDGYPYVNQRTMHTDRHDIRTGRIDRRFYDSNRSTPLADCRCLDCQRERSKVLNYYPD